MLAIERKNEILAILQKEQRVLVSELSRRYEVTDETIRRDLEKLEKEGFVKRTYGGAVLNKRKDLDMPLRIREKTNRGEKQIIAGLVKDLIEEGDRIMLDASSTSLMISKELKEMEKLTVITNSVEVLIELAGHDGIQVISTGGNLNETSLSLVGNAAQKVLNGYHVDKAVFSCKGIDMKDGSVCVTLAFSGRRDPLAEYIIGSARAALIRNLPSGVKSEVRTVVVEETKEKKKPNVNELGVEQLKDVGNIIGVASGKGGVGKSTVAVNLACALARLGYKVGLADADVYGPSVPTMTATEGLSPMAEETADGKELILPVEKYGVKWMSIGYFAEKGQALIWRGPMACNALKQMILQVKWGELDFLLVDMPPGTGDIHISLLQDIPVDGAIVVTTPQKVALADVEKGVNMFRNPGVGKPIFGLVENMAWFTPEEHPDERYYIFGKDGGAEMASALGIDLLGRIPLVQGLRESGDAGEPAALSSRPDGVAFLELAGRLAGKLGLK